MGTWIIRETKKDSKEPRRQWRIHFQPFTEKGMYRQIGSFNAFFHNGERNWKDKNGNYTLYHAEDEISHNITQDCLKKYGLDNRDLPIVDVKDVWELYKIIGYDYKKRKWIK